MEWQELKDFGRDQIGENIAHAKVWYDEKERMTMGVLKTYNMRDAEDLAKQLDGRRMKDVEGRLNVYVEGDRNKRYDDRPLDRGGDRGGYDRRDDRKGGYDDRRDRGYDRRDDRDYDDRGKGYRDDRGGKGYRLSLV